MADEKKVHDSPTGVPASDEAYSLEEILTEYGGGLERTLLRGTEEREERSVSAAEDISPEAAAPPAPEMPGEADVPEEPETPEETAGPETPEDSEPPKDAAMAENPASPQAEAAVDPDVLEGEGRPISLEEVVGSTVEAVLEERPQPVEPPQTRRRSLFSRRRMPEEQPEAEPEPEPIPPEPAPYEASVEFRAELRRRKRALPGAIITALLPTLCLLLEKYGRTVPLWSGDDRRQTMILLACLAAEAVFCRCVFAKAVRMVGEGRCVSELLASLGFLAAAADCALRLGQPARTDAAPYAAVTCMALAFSLWGNCRESLGLFGTFRTAALDDDPPYLVTETKRGACKQRGASPGFYTTALQNGGAALWQTAALPVALAATVVFAGLTSLGQERGADFFLNWSALLAAAATFSLPLCWGLPFSQLAERLQKAGCAVAGWSGAEKISRGRAMVLSDADLFPPGSVQLNGVKVYGEELPRAASYAASMARAAGCGLERIFDGLLREESGQYETVDDFGFYKEGGWSGVIRGESVLMGTAPFLGRMGVRLPEKMHLKTGIFMAVDKRLTAVFAVKYDAAENVDFALEMLRRGRVTPILASRDPNITPSLLKRKFSRNVKVEYPDLTTRVALSEVELGRGLPRALIFREGLLPYAEAVVGSGRLCRAVRQAAALSLLGCGAGILLVYYLVGIGQYAVLTPLALEMFLLLWTLPVLLIANLAGRY